jgi:hypothetical protein
VLTRHPPTYLARAALPVTAAHLTHTRLPAAALGPAPVPGPAPGPGPTPDSRRTSASAPVSDDPKAQKAIEQLKARVERLKYENGQLEEMLATAEEQVGGRRWC